MKLTTAVVAALVLCLMMCNKCASQKSDIVRLVQSWPAAVCLVDSNCVRQAPNPNLFLIHGSWPQRSDGVAPECTNDPFVKSQLQYLTQKLSRVWVSLKSKNDDAFWKHEWDVHGTCSGLAIREYFSLTLTAYQKNSLKDALNSAGIIMGNAYPASKYAEAVKAVTKFAPIITCKEVQSGPQKGVQVLYEISVCMDQMMASYTKCVNRKINCNTAKNVLYVRPLS